MGCYHCVHVGHAPEVPGALHLLDELLRGGSLGARQGGVAAAVEPVGDEVLHVAPAQVLRIPEQGIMAGLFG